VTCDSTQRVVEDSRWGKKGKPLPILPKQPVSCTLIWCRRGTRHQSPRRLAAADLWFHLERRLDRSAARDRYSVRKTWTSVVGIVQRHLLATRRGLSHIRHAKRSGIWLLDGDFSSVLPAYRRGVHELSPAAAWDHLERARSSGPGRGRSQVSAALGRGELTVHQAVGDHLQGAHRSSELGRPDDGISALVVDNTSVPFGLNCESLTPEPVSNTVSCSPVAALQMRALPSALEKTTMEPFGLNAAEYSCAPQARP